MNKKLYVGNFSYSTGSDELRRTFAPYGKLVSVSVVTDHITGQPRGFGFVEFERASDAQKAIAAVDGREVDGRSLNVNIARGREPKARFDGGGADFGGAGSASGGLHAESRTHHKGICW